MQNAVVHDIAIRLLSAVELLKGPSSDALNGIDQVEYLANLMLEASHEH